MRANKALRRLRGYQSIFMAAAPTSQRIGRGKQSFLCQSLCPRVDLDHLPPPYTNQSGKEKLLVTIDDYKGPFVTVQVTYPLRDQRNHVNFAFSEQEGHLAAPSPCLLLALIFTRE
jgi:hypothetical protein